MGRKTAIAIACFVVLLLGGAVGAYAWDSSKAGKIAEGIRVGEIDLGGLGEAEATELLSHELVKPLSKPVKVTHGKETFKLRAGELDVHADIDGMVSEALARSRAGGLPVRLVRYATGDTVDHRIEPKVVYSETAVDRFVDRVAAKLNTEPQNASINPSTTTLTTVKEQDGVALRDGRLGADIRRVLDSGGSGSRTVKAKVKTVEPEVTVEELAAQYPVYLTVDRASFTLRLFKHLELKKEYTVAVGAAGYDTPTGVYNIQNKAVDPTWNVPNSDWAGELAGTVVPGGSPQNPLKERWLGIYAGAGIHGTDAVGSLGSAASHGCIRMAIPDVIELYDQVPVGAPVYIQ